VPNSIMSHSSKTYELERGLSLTTARNLLFE
jgi:hypothetical protein